MTMNQLRYFQMLAKTEHYRQAADQLFISQPSLSKAIASLENELDVTLFEKSGRNVRMTEAGAAFNTYVNQALETLDRGILEARNISLESKKISIGCIMPALLTYLAPALREYQEHFHKEIKYITRIGISEDLLRDLVTGLYDIVFCTYVPNIKKVTYTLVCELPYCVVVHKDSAFAKKSGICPEELNGYPMLFTESSAYAQTIQELLDFYQIHPILAGLSNDETGLLGMVEAGLGVFISVDYPQVRSESTTLVPLIQDQFRRRIYMAVREGCQESAALQDLVAYLTVSGQNRSSD